MPQIRKRQKRIDLASSLTLLVTLVLFAIAAFHTGLTHDLLLEAGVFLVSAKLVIASHQSKLENEAMHRKLDELAERLGSHSVDVNAERT